MDELLKLIIFLGVSVKLNYKIDKKFYYTGSLVQFFPSGEALCITKSNNIPKQYKICANNNNGMKFVNFADYTKPNE